MIRFFDEVDQLTRELRTLFQVDREEYLTVRFTDTYEDGSGGQTGGIFYYKNERNKGIIARKFDALRHEYVHYLYACRVDVDGAEHVQWCNEALAYWYGQADNYAYFRLAYRVDEAARWYFETLLGQPFDAPEDYVAFCILNAREILDSQGRNMLRYDLMKDLGGYKEAFGAYFIETYGEQTFIDCMLAPSLTEARCGKVLEDIVEDWMDALPELNEVQRALLSETDM